MMRQLGAVVVGIGVLVTMSACTPEAADSLEKADAPGVVLERRPGLWKHRIMAGRGAGVESLEICLDAATDRQLSWWDAGLGCREHTISRERDGSWRFKTVCDLRDGGKVTNLGHVVGDLSKAYQLVGSTSISGHPQAQANQTVDMTIDAEWVGECPAELKPGQVRLPSGEVVNAPTPKS